MLPRLRTRNVAAQGRKPRALAASSRHAPSFPSSRRGIATIWVLASMPVMLTLLVMLVDAGNLWVARAELKNALDAAALSGVKTWGQGSSTLQARLDAHDAFNTNTILGTQYSLLTAEGGCTNGNPSPSATAEILLGTISDGVSGFTFDCQGTPACVSGTFTLRIAVDTEAICDGGGNDTFERESAFRIEEFTTSNPALTLNSITFSLPSAAGFFDLRNPPPSNDGNSGYNVGDAFPPPTIYYRVAPPATNATSVFLSGCASPFATFGVTSAIYNLPPTAAPAAGLTDPPDVTNPTFRWSFTGFEAGDVFAFGVDTDFADGNVGAGGNTDKGGEFAGAVVTGSVSGSAFVGVLAAVNLERSEVTINGTVTGGDSFGVRTRKTVSVPSVASTFLGLSLNPYQVTSQSYARFACSSGLPQSVHINTYSCACP